MLHLQILQIKYIEEGRFEEEHMNRKLLIKIFCTVYSKVPST